MPNYKMVDADALDGAMLATAEAIRTKGGTEELIAWNKSTGYKEAVEAIKGGGGLNFEVVGGTEQPANPKENTIWVNTEQEITGWAFSKEEPAAPQEGNVWIALCDLDTTRVGVIEFNAIEENAINLRTARIWQYINGAYVPQGAKVYQSSEWLDVWDGVLYDSGVITPGYCGVHNANTYPSKYSIGTGVFEENRWAFSVSSGQVIGLQTVEKIDITGFNKLCVKSGGVGVRFGLSENIETYTSWIVTGTSTSDNSYEGTLDISGVEDGEYYISAGAYKSASGTDTGYVYKFWLE